MLSACETFAAEIVFAAWQMTFLCFVVWLFGVFSLLELHLQPLLDYQAENMTQSSS